MENIVSDKYAAGEQGLGYMYQPRLALLKLFELPENTSVFLEKDDDLDFIDMDGGKILASLKHKAEGDRLTDLSTDFWKSVRIWLNRYKRDGRIETNFRFFLFTTSSVQSTSFLNNFLTNRNVVSAELVELVEKTNVVLNKSKSKLITKIANEFNELTLSEKQDFLTRVFIIDVNHRIEDIPSIIKSKHMRSIRREFRDSVFKHLEGWWNDEVIKQLTGKREEGIFGFEVSDKLHAISQEYTSDNLPITFRNKEPSIEINTDDDPRTFVVQLRDIGISSQRIRNAILDYYRAFEQRSEWARENILVTGEIESYEDRLVDEWSRYKDVVFEDLDENSAENILKLAGKELYKWADMQSGNIESLRIRSRVTEPYVIRGSFHILANSIPVPKVYWHPRFLYRLDTLLGVNK